MKLLKRLFIVQLTIASFILFSCFDNDNNNNDNDTLINGFPKQINGTWVFKNNELTWYYIFIDDTNGVKYRLMTQYDGENAVIPFEYIYQNTTGILAFIGKSPTYYFINANSYNENQFTASLNETQQTIIILRQPVNPVGSIIGKWRENFDDGHYYLYNFNRDQSISRTEVYGNKKSVKNGQYSFNARTMILSITYNYDYMPSETSTRVLLELSNSKIISQSNDGQESWLRN